MMLPSTIAFFWFTTRALALPAEPSNCETSFVRPVNLVTKYVYVDCTTSNLNNLGLNSLVGSLSPAPLTSSITSRSIPTIQVSGKGSRDGLASDLSTTTGSAKPTYDISGSQNSVNRLTRNEVHQQRKPESYVFTLENTLPASKSSLLPIVSPSTTATSPATFQTQSKIKETDEQDGLPFHTLVAFGDNLSDNGNGSYAHKVTSSPGEDNKVYGYGTWTDHQVAVSYLADLLRCPLTHDYAFGHAWGGSASGATVDDTLYFSDFRSSKISPPYFPTQFSSPCNGAPSSKVQIADYVRNGVDNTALHFLWIGNNDVNMETMIEKSDTFANSYAEKVTDQVRTLREAGAEYVIIVNIYAKHLAPVLPSYYGWTTPEQKTAFASFISKANTALQTSLASRFDARQVLYYDVFNFMQALWDHGANHGFKNKLDINGQPACCDDDKALTKEVKQMYAMGQVKGMTEESNWGVCVKQERWAEWFWMQNLDMTSAVHEFIANDMSERIREHWAQ